MFPGYNNLDDYRNDSGELVNVGIGAYRQIYVCKNGDELCAVCAQESLDEIKECGFYTGDEPFTAYSSADTDSRVECADCGAVLAEGNELSEVTVERHYSAYLLTNADGSTELIQSDWDYPAYAQRLGWDIRSVQSETYTEDNPEPCEHRGTDGTVNCPDCGVTASEFITAAGEFLDDF